MYFRWGNPPIATFESIYIALSGFSNAVTISAVFVFLSAATRKEDTAVASGAFYLAMCLGEVTGVALQNSIFQGTLRQVLPGLLREVEHSNEVCTPSFSAPFLNLDFCNSYCSSLLLYMPCFSSSEPLIREVQKSRLLSPAYGFTDHPPSHLQREQHLALPFRHPKDRHRYVCARFYIYIS